MRTLYLDASALVKLVVRETETAALTEYIAAAEDVFTSALAAVEVPRAAARADTGGDALATAAEVLARCRRVELDDAIEAAAVSVQPVALKTVDAIHLASALRVRELLGAVVVYDQQLACAARDAGLTVVSPGRDD